MLGGQGGGRVLAQVRCLSLSLTHKKSSKCQHVMAAEPGEDGVYPDLEALQAAFCCAAGCCAGRALPGSALLLSALRAQPQALQHCWELLYVFNQL
ncbi:hypothetical protein PAMP_014099 [Pampus punctatissimus]